jgi:hypothetical protein
MPLYGPGEHLLVVTEGGSGKEWLCVQPRSLAQ